MLVQHTDTRPDIHRELKILSESFQSNALVIADVSRNLNKSLHSLKKMKATPGEHEAKFRIEIAKDDGADCLATCQLFDADDATFKELRNDKRITVERQNRV